MGSGEQQGLEAWTRPVCRTTQLGGFSAVVVVVAVGAVVEGVVCGGVLVFPFLAFVVNECNMNQVKLWW